MNLELEGAIVAVTGSSRGIGYAIAEAFLKEGARVILSARDHAALQAAAGILRDRHGFDQVFIFAGDLEQSAVAEELCSFISKELGKLDHLVCNIGSGRSVPLSQEDVAEWQRMLNINLFSAITCTYALLPLLDRTALDSGSVPGITFISSICGVEALGCPIAYAAAKSALISYAKNIARPLGNRGIRVNVISPGNIIFSGSIWEAKIADDKTAVEDMIRREVPLQRLGTAEEVANVAVFLASRRASFVTGVNWVVDGGQTRTL